MYTKEKKERCQKKVESVYGRKLFPSNFQEHNKFLELQENTPIGFI
jgi:hypothetical protein